LAKVLILLNDAPEDVLNFFNNLRYLMNKNLLVEIVIFQDLSEACFKLEFITLLSIFHFYGSVCFAQTLINPATDLKYVGAFRVPLTGIDYGGNALAYNPANNSLFITGNAAQDQTLEISIPARISSSTNINDLASATAIQTPHDATNGTLSNIFPDPTAGQKYIYGHLVYNNKLIVSAVSK
jgi:hypothetical protein